MGRASLLPMRYSELAGMVMGRRTTVTRVTHHGRYFAYDKGD
jgi:hypothetical protein